MKKLSKLFAKRPKGVKQEKLATQFAGTERFEDAQRLDHLLGIYTNQDPRNYPEYAEHFENLRDNLPQTMVDALQNPSFDLQKAEERFKVLVVYLPLVFPDEPQTDKIVRRLNWLGENANQDSNDYTMFELPYHTHDQEWLAKYATEEINRFHFQTKPVTLPLMQDIVDTPVFNHACREFEQRLVKSYINLLAAEIQDAHAVPNWGGDWEYDRAFRDQVVNMMVRFGIDKHVAEVGLEKNAHLWREKAMLKTFNETYYPQSATPKDPKLARRWTSIHNAHEGVWLQEREYLYYQQHKAVIDELGLATDNMKITPRKATALISLAEHLDCSREKTLRKWKAMQQPTAERTL